MKKTILFFVLSLCVFSLFSAGTMEAMISNEMKTHIAIVSSGERNEGLIRGAEMVGAARDDVQVDVLMAQNALETDAVLLSAINSNYDLIATYGILPSLVLDKALMYKDETFAILGEDSEEKPQNLISFLPSISSSSYLCGIAAASLTETKAIGIIADKEEEYLKEGVEAFIRGVNETDSNCSVIVSYLCDGYLTPNMGKIVADSIFNDGCDTIYSLSLDTMDGIIQSAVENNGKIISGLTLSYSKVVSLSVENGIERLVMSFVDKVLDGVDGGTTVTLGLEEGRSELSWFIGDEVEVGEGYALDKAYGAVSRARDIVLQPYK